MKSKLSTLEDSIIKIKDGAMVAVGGMTNYRRPVALSLEIVHQKKRHLTLFTMTSGLESDLMIGTGCVDVVRSCYVGLEIFGMAPMFRKKAENGEIQIIEETETSVAAGLRATLGGLTFLPARVLLGTDVLKVRSDIRMVTCPYTGEQLPALPAIKPDVALIHALASDEQGNAVLGGNLSVDVEMARTAEVTILSTEAVVPHEAIIEKGADLIGLDVDYVVPIRRGAHPTSCFPDYLLDGQVFVDYIQSCQENRFELFVRGLCQSVLNKV
jgi:glutaconate CoA-transferase subunit A